MFRIFLLVSFIGISSFHAQDGKMTPVSADAEEIAMLKDPVGYWEAQANMHNLEQSVKGALVARKMQRRIVEETNKQEDFGEKVCFPQVAIFYALKLKKASDAYTTALNAGNVPQEQLDYLKSKHNFIKMCYADAATRSLLAQFNNKICGKYPDSKDKNATEKSIKKIIENLEEYHHKKEKKFEASFVNSKLFLAEQQSSEKFKEEVENEAKKLLKI